MSENRVLDIQSNRRVREIKDSGAVLRHSLRKDVPTDEGPAEVPDFRRVSEFPATGTAACIARPRDFPRTQLRLFLACCANRSENNLTAALKASERRLSALLQDRRRIGRELHDTVLQALYAIGLSLAQSHELRRGAPQARPHTRDQATDQLHTLIQDIRRMILSVETDCVDPFRLISELQALAETI